MMNHVILLDGDNVSLKYVGYYIKNFVGKTYSHCFIAGNSTGNNVRKWSHFMRDYAEDLDSIVVPIGVKNAADGILLVKAGQYMVRYANMHITIATNDIMIIDSIALTCPRTHAIVTDNGSASHCADRGYSFTFLPMKDKMTLGTLKDDENRKAETKVKPVVESPMLTESLSVFLKDSV